MLAVRQSPVWALFVQEITAKYNALFADAMNHNLTAQERTMRLEQMRGLAYAQDLLDALINQIEEEIEATKEIKEYADGTETE
ncbi:hypothetical protein [Hydrogenimonas sp.]